jgi:RHS repeat-associated protein
LSSDRAIGGDVVEEDFTYEVSTGRLVQHETWRASTGFYGSGPTQYDASGNSQFSARVKMGSWCALGDALVCVETHSNPYVDVSRSMYDAGERLRRVVRQSTETNPRRESVDGAESYEYYDLGPGSPRQDLHFERYVWDGNQILYEIRARSVVSSVDRDDMSETEFGRVGYVHGVAIDQPMKVFRADIAGGPVWRQIYLHADWRGAITLGSWPDGSKDRDIPWQKAMIDWEVRNQQTYFQRMTKFTSTNFTYFGSLLSSQVDGSRLQYLRNRYYDPQLGRFTQEDPIGLAGGLNLYGFAGGDPVNFSDPFGLCDDPTDPKCRTLVDDLRDRINAIERAVSHGVKQGLEEINRLIEKIPVLGDATKAATGVDPAGAPLSEGERGIALAAAVGTALVPVGGHGPLAHGTTRAMGSSPEFCVKAEEAPRPFAYAA